MEITEEQIKEFKGQIIQQIQSTFSEEKKEPAIERINSMNQEEFIEFLKKNKLLNSDSDKESDKETQNPNQNESPFRLIAEGKIPSYILDENKNAIAVLEIKPISKAHTIIIPKKAVLEANKMPQSILSFAKKISKKIKTKLNPKEVLILSSHLLGETIINILPVYTNESLDSPRKQISPEELEKLKDTLEEKQKMKVVKEPKVTKIKESNMWLPKRIP